MNPATVGRVSVHRVQRLPGLENTAIETSQIASSMSDDDNMSGLLHVLVVLVIEAGRDQRPERGWAVDIRQRTGRKGCWRRIMMKGAGQRERRAEHLEARRARKSGWSRHSHQRGAHVSGG